MLAFAANSVLARLALAPGDLGALGYTGIRLVSGAAMLAALLYIRRDGEARRLVAGSWPAAAALFAYALAFSIAYLLLGAGTGALILFVSVQFGILGWAVFRGDRPGPAEWLGLMLALAALVFLVAPGLVAPPWPGTLLMIVAGLSWAAYTLLGRGSRAPLADTAGNFIRCLPPALVLLIAGGLSQVHDLRLIACAIASGALASGLGYAIWYGVLPALSRTGAGLVQLTVPAIAAAGGVLLLGEPLTPRLLLASMGILGGVALALFAAEGRKKAKVRSPG
jgi:drug/metabolite transporter (DMT)-like permease